MYGYPKDPSCRKSAPKAKTCDLQAVDRHTDRQTNREKDRQTEKVNTEDPFFDFFLVMDFLLKERSEILLAGKI